MDEDDEDEDGDCEAEDDEGLCEELDDDDGVWDEEDCDGELLEGDVLDGVCASAAPIVPSAVAATSNVMRFMRTPLWREGNVSHVTGASQPGSPVWMPAENSLRWANLDQGNHVARGR